MKKTFLTLFLTLSIFVCRGWEYEFSGLANNNVVHSGVIELNNGDLLILFQMGKEFGSASMFNTCYLLHLTGKGEFLDTVNLTDYFSGYKFGGSAINYIENEIIITGAAVDSSYQYHPAILKISEDLLVTFDTIFNFIGFTMNIWPLANSEFLLWGYTGDHLVWSMTTYWHLDKNFNIMRSGYDTLCVRPYFFGMATVSTSGNFIYHNLIPFSLRITRWNIEDFTLGRELPFSGNASIWNAPFVTSNENRILIARHEFGKNIFATNEHLSILKLDSTLTRLDSAIFEDSIENRIPDLPPAIAEINGHFYYGASRNQPSGFLVNEKTLYSAFMLLKYDEDLNLKWVKKYRNDCAYRMRSLIKTNDSGILMIGKRWNWPEDSLKKEVSLYVLKVDEDGNPTGVDEQKFNSPKLTIYPNPSSDFVHINLSGNGEYEVKTIKVVNTLGESVHQAEFNGSQYKLDSSKWPAGTYFISVTTKEGKETGRFVKL